MEFAQRIIDWKPTAKYDGEATYIMPLGDIQWNGDPHDVTLDLLRERIDLGVKLNALFIGMGDYTDLTSPSNRQRVKAAGFYDNFHQALEKTSHKFVEEIYDIFAPTKGRWLGLLSGHHFYHYEDGTTSDQELCRLLDAPFLGSNAIVGLHYRRPDGGIAGTVNIWAHHGVGGGQAIGAVLRKLNNPVRHWDANIFLLGHYTKMATEPVNYIYTDWKAGEPKLRHITKVLVGTGGFSKGYIERNKIGGVPSGTYVEKGMMNPATLGNPIVEIRPRIMDKTDSTGVRTRWFYPQVYAKVGG